MHFMINEKVSDDFLKNQAAVIKFSGFLSLSNLKLILTIIKLRPSIEIVIYGENFFHDKILDAVSLLNRLFCVNGNIVLYNGKEREFEFETIKLIEKEYSLLENGLFFLTATFLIVSTVWFFKCNWLILIFICLLESFGRR